MNPSREAQLLRRIEQLERQQAQMHAHLFKRDEYLEMTADPPITPEEQAVVTNVMIDTTSLQFLKKTRKIIGKFSAGETGWTNWHQGTTCGTVISPGNMEASTGENVSAAAATMALLRLTRAI